MLNNFNQIPVENDMRAVLSLTRKVLANSEKPAHQEVSEVLENACSDWFDRIEFLEEQNKKYMALLQKIENNSKEGLSPHMTPEDYEAFYNNQY